MSEPGDETTVVTDGAVFPRPFGRYRLLGALGRGGMGTVYLAHDPVLERRLALKLPRPDALKSPQALERFYREARAAAGINHRNICQVFDVGCFEGQHFLSMAYIEGESLAHRIHHYLDQPRQVAELIRTLARALEEAHQRGIIHRDLKPTNIMIDAGGEPVIMDFGLARRVEREDADRTSHGMILGTPAYMPPEQAEGDTSAIGKASDIYSLGVTLYELLCGRVPFEGSAVNVLAQVLREEPPPPSSYRPSVDPRLEAICLKAMSRRPEDRFASMAEFAAALEDFLAGRSVQAELAPAATTAGRLLEGILREFRCWGWERGLRRVRDWLPACADLSPEDRPRLLHWLEGERDGLERLLEGFRDEPLLPSVQGWVATGRAWMALKHFQLPRGRQLIEEALAVPRSLDCALDGVLAYMRGFILSREGKWEEAIPILHQALEWLGRDHFLTGSVLDALGRVYAGKCNFLAACEFYQQALARKSQAGDEMGLVLTCEELGRVYIEQELFDRAESHLEAGLLVAERLSDELGQARVLNHLGRVALYRGEREMARGKQAAAHKLYKQAAEYFDWAVGIYQRLNQTVPEGRARKYVALTRLYEGKLEEAEESLRRGEMLLREAGFPQGPAEIHRFTARLRSVQGRHEEAVQLLRQALAQFDALNLPIEGTRTQFELAKALMEAKSPGRLVVRALQDALLRAEKCRRGELVERIEEALKAVDEEAHWRHVFRRVRGHGAPENTSSLCSGSSEPVSVLALELIEFGGYCQGLDPEAVMNTLNQLLAELQIVLERHRAQIMSYLGGGFLALVREAGHAERAVQASLDLLEMMAEFNRPRQILGLPQLPARIGVASGFVFLGNIGTYHNLHFAAVGAPVNLATSLMRRGSPTAPCISQESHEQVGDRFTYAPGSPRQLDIAGIGKREVWDVIGRAPQGVGNHARR